MFWDEQEFSHSKCRLNLLFAALHDGNQPSSLHRNTKQ
jgi:hypothetical protein